MSKIEDERPRLADGIGAAINGGDRNSNFSRRRELKGRHFGALPRSIRRHKRRSELQEIAFTDP